MEHVNLKACPLKLGSQRPKEVKAYFAKVSGNKSQIYFYPELYDGNLWKNYNAYH